MTDEWFDEYMFRLVIHKQFIDEETLKILDLEPIILPPWDPMFQPDDEKSVISSQGPDGRR